MTSITSCSPIGEADPDSNPNEIGVNDLFRQLNDILKQRIDRNTKTDSLEVGDKIKNKDGSLKISIHEFTASNGFPVRFRPQDKEVLEDKTVIPIVDDFDGSSEYVIKKNSSEESSEEKKNESSSKVTTNPDKNVTTQATSDAQKSFATGSSKSTESFSTTESSPHSSTPLTSATTT